MKIMPAISSGVVLMHEDGTFEMAPFQVFRSDKGQTIIRLGNNTLWFDENGKFDGNECKVPEAGTTDMGALQEAFKAQEGNKNRAPVPAYFQEDTSGWKREVADWPKKPASN